MSSEALIHLAIHEFLLCRMGLHIIEGSSPKQESQSVPSALPVKSSDFNMFKIGVKHIANVRRRHFETSRTYKLQVSVKSLVSQWRNATFVFAMEVRTGGGGQREIVVYGRCLSSGVKSKVFGSRQRAWGG